MMQCLFAARKTFAVLWAFLAVSLAAAGGAFAQGEPAAIRIGYAVSLTGPYAGPASSLPVANYRLWAKDVNARGGLQVGPSGRRVPVELVEYDDASSPDNAIRLTEKLITDDKVAFVLPPWGTAMNLAVAPVYRKHGYPQLATTALTNATRRLVRTFDTLFFFVADADDYATALVGLLGRLKDAGKINDKVAILSVADQFGSDLASAAEGAFKKAGFAIALRKSYPMATQDLSGDIGQAQASGADSFIAFSYPPDTFMINGQAQTLRYNPKVFYTAVGTAFPAFKGRFGDKAEGVIGAGGWDATTAEAQAYIRGYRELTGNEPDRWASPATYASLQALEQAVAIGGLDRKAVMAALRTASFQTVVGRFALKDQVRTVQPLVSQWQSGAYAAIEPDGLPGVQPLLFPKPSW